jgi:hypothetical protein
MLSKLIATVCGWFGGKNEVSVTEQIDRQVNKDVDTVTVVAPKELQPKKPFVFPESLVAYRAAVRENRAAWNVAKTAHETKLTTLHHEMVQSKAASSTGGDNAGDELARRDAFARSQQAEAEIKSEKERYEKVAWGWRWDELFEQDVRAEENERVAHEGQIVLQEYTDAKESASKEGAKVERRLVRLVDGRFYTCHVEYPATMQGTGRTTVVRVGSYRETRTVPTYEPTGEYGAPTVKWVSGSLAQFTNEELKLVASND